MKKLEITLCSATLGEDGKTEPPIGPLYIAAAMEEVSVKVDFRDFQLYENANGYSGDTLADFLTGHANIVALSCFVDMLPAVIDATRKLYEHRPNTQFVLGGPGPTEKASEILKEYPWITCIVRSEGEKTIQEWIKKKDDYFDTEIAGLTYRVGDKVVKGKNRVRIYDLDSLPRPAYHLINFDDYDNARIITTRGCSYDCSFCDVAALWGNRSVFRDIDLVIDEMEMLRDTYGVNYVGIVDDTFVLNRKRVREFCSKLISRNVDMKWGCFGRINLMNEELIEQMSSAGCKAIFYGIDSGSQKILKETRKKVKLESIYEVVKISAKYFDQIEASFIWGYPSESLEDFNKTVQLASSLSEFAPKVNIQMHMLSPLPSSPEYLQFDGTLMEPDANDKEWLLLPELFLNPKSNRLREIIRANPNIYPGFFTFPTPSKEEKRAQMFEIMKKLHQMIGLTLLDPVVTELLNKPNEELERKLMESAQNVTQRIGLGLSFGYFKRLRKYDNMKNNKELRTKKITRVRNDKYASA